MQSAPGLHFGVQVAGAELESVCALFALLLRNLRHHGPVSTHTRYMQNNVEWDERAVEKHSQRLARLSPQA